MLDQELIADLRATILRLNIEKSLWPRRLDEETASLQAEKLQAEQARDTAVATLAVLQVEQARVVAQGQIEQAKVKARLYEAQADCTSLKQEGSKLTRSLEVQGMQMVHLHSSLEAVDRENKILLARELAYRAALVKFSNLNNWVPSKYDKQVVVCKIPNPWVLAGEALR